jgi:hypothetical protein
MPVFIGATPAPLRDRIKGSRVNPKGSAASSKGNINFSAPTTQSIRSIIAGSNVSLATAKAVVRRGFGAYSTSHRPNVSRTAWGLARLKQFVKKSKGQAVNPRYIQDNDLL